MCDDVACTRSEVLTTPCVSQARLVCFHSSGSVGLASHNARALSSSLPGRPLGQHDPSQAAGDQGAPAPRLSEWAGARQSSLIQLPPPLLTVPAI